MYTCYGSELHKIPRMYVQYTRSNQIVMKEHFRNGKKSWISWPLAFILASGNREGGPRRNADVATLAEKEVSMR